MKIPGSMLLVATLVSAAAMAVSNPVGAAERLSDVDFMNASRCAGLAEGFKIENTSLKALLEDQRGWREGFIQEKADEMRQEAAGQVRRANAAGKQRISAELNGACKTYLGSSPTVAAR